MRTMIAVAAFVASVFALQTPALAENGRAQLRLTVVDETSTPLPNATVTIFTMHGPRTVNTDAKGVVRVADLPAEMTQWWARTSRLSGAEAAKLHAGENKATLTLHAVAGSESGS